MGLLYQRQPEEADQHRQGASQPEGLIERFFFSGGRELWSRGVAIIEVATLHGRDRSAVDDDLAAMNRRGARRDEEANKLRHLFGSTGSTDGDPTERLHEPFASGRLVVPVLFCKALHHP